MCDMIKDDGDDVDEVEGRQQEEEEKEEIHICQFLPHTRTHISFIDRLDCTLTLEWSGLGGFEFITNIVMCVHL